MQSKMHIKNIRAYCNQHQNRQPLLSVSQTLTVIQSEHYATIDRCENHKANSCGDEYVRHECWGYLRILMPNLFSAFIVIIANVRSEIS